MGGIYSRVREIRRARRLTQAQVAKRMGVSVAAVKNYEHNRHLPRAAKLQELATALDCSVAALTAPPGSPIPAPRRRKLLGRISAAVLALAVLLPEPSPPPAFATAALDDGCRSVKKCGRS
jgi:transcriptional regulator with XRE-family HTH domain